MKQVSEFLVSFVLPVEAGESALTGDQFMDILTEVSTLWFEPYPDINLSSTQLRPATDEEIENLSWKDDELEEDDLEEDEDDE